MKLVLSSKLGEDYVDDVYFLRTESINAYRPLVFKTTDNLFEANLTIVGVKIRHDYEWGCDNLVKVCLGLS
jgi:hypothetical protein